MAANERFVALMRRRNRESLTRIGGEIRLARVARGLSQSKVGERGGMSHTKIGRIEAGEARVPLADVALVAAVVGLELRLSAFPVGPPLRDEAHAQLLERLRGRLAADARWRTEVPLPNPGDLRAWDAMFTIDGVRIGVEAETRVRDGQELERRLAAKRRDGGVDRVILLLSDTRANRAFIRERSESLRQTYPVPGRELLHSLANDIDPGGDAIVML